MYLSDWFFEEVLVELDVLSVLFNTDVATLLERAPAAHVRWRAHWRIRQIGEDGPLEVQRDAARYGNSFARQALIAATGETEVF